MKMLLLLLLIISSLEFWSFFLIPKELMYLGYLISWIIMGYSFLTCSKKGETPFTKPIIFLFVGIFINMLSAYIHHGQSLPHTFLGFKNYSFILIFFVLLKKKISVASLEKIIIFFAVIYSIFYLVQMSLYPMEIFETKIYEDRGTLRIRLAGSGFLILSILMCVNKFFTQKKIYLALGLIFFLVLILGGFRLLPLVVLLCSAIIFLRTNKLSISTIIILIIACIPLLALTQVPQINDILIEMIARSESDAEVGTDSIRFVQFAFFFGEYIRSDTLIYLFGHGMPNGDSSYGQEIMFYQENYNLYWMDLGWFGLWIMTGLLVAISIAWLSFRAIFYKIPKETIYASIFFLYLILTSFTSMEIFRPGIFGVQGIALYILYTSHKKK